MTHLMGADLSNIVKTQKLTDDHVQFLVYQLLRGLKVSNHPQSDAIALASNLIELAELQIRCPFYVHSMMGMRPNL